MVHEENIGARVESSPQPHPDAERQRASRAVQPDHPAGVFEAYSTRYPPLEKRASGVSPLLQPRKAAYGAWYENPARYDQSGSKLLNFIRHQAYIPSFSLPQIGFRRRMELMDSGVQNKLSELRREAEERDAER